MIAIVVSALLLGAPELATMTFGPLHATADSFEVSLHAPIRSLRRAEKHLLVGRRLVLFVPGVAATAQTTAIETGPVAQLRVASAQRGVAITLTMRGNSAAGLEQLLVSTDPEPMLRYQTMVATTAIHAADSNSAAVAPSASTLSEALSTEVAPSHRPSPVQAALTRERLSAGKAALAASTGGPEGGARLPLMATSLVLLVAAAGVVRYRQKRQNRLSHLGASIDVMAVHSFGAKQKLVLVNTCGDRLLLATSDKEVRLIKNLGPKGVEPTFDDALSAAGGEPTPIRSADIAGLLALRERHGHTGLTDDERGAAA
jgi:flagellar biogenesis protein FliO